MPTFTGKTFASFYKNLFGIDQSSNTGVDSTTRSVQDGAGNPTSISLSDDQLKVQPVNDDTTRTLIVQDNGGDRILVVDTTNSKVLLGASQVPPTLVKEMGLFDFSPTAGYHNPLIANTMMFSDSGSDIIEDQSMFSNGTDPATTLDLSADGTPMIAVACYWYLDNDITIDSIRYMATAGGSDNFNFHLFAYALNTTSNLGDLSGGTLHAHVDSVAATLTTVATGTLTLDTADIDQGKVVIGFVESDSTTDLTCTFNINYHIR
tara:strand:+ start:1572 stop:2360 length:789 start_codon:yes stop_codon:yes gene_type:complete